jgi:hypothetical protein
VSDQGQQKTKENAAATGFIVLLAAAAGWAGVLVAAIAVGWERAWNGRGGGAQARAVSREGRLASHRTWLAEDAKQREQWRQRRREWWAAGADPASEPKSPALAKRSGAWVRRRWARTRVGLAEFVTGFVAGWQAASEERRAGGGFRSVARTRPTEDTNPDAVVHDDCTYCLGCTKCRPPKYGWSCPRCGVRREGFASEEAAKADSKIHCCGEKPPSPAAATAPETSKGETIVTAPTQTPATSPGAATESNAAIMAQRLAEVAAGNQAIEELTDQLAALRNQQALRVQKATEFAEQTGQSAETRQALDASNAVVESLGQQVGSVSDSVVEAGDQVNAAHQGLQPVIQAEDALTAAGADGRAVAPATAD